MKKIMLLLTSIIMLSSCIQHDFTNIIRNKFAFVRNEYQYGNELHTVVQLHRRIVATDDYLFVCHGGNYSHSENGEQNYSEVCRIDSDGNKDVICQALVGQMSFYDGQLYFSDWNHANNAIYYSTCLYKVSPDEKELEIFFCSESDWSFNRFLVVEDNIYLYGLTKEIKVLNLEGDVVSQIPIEDNIWYIQIFDDQIFYVYADKVYCSDLKGYNMSLLIQSKSKMVCYVDNEGIYCYFEENSSIYKYSLHSGNKESKIVDNIPGIVEEMFVSDGILYYSFVNPFDFSGMTLILEKNYYQIPNNKYFLVMFYVVNIAK